MFKLKNLYLDLNIPYTPDSNKLFEDIKHAVKIGYDGVAINYFVEDVHIKTGKKKQDKKDIPHSSSIKLTDEKIKELTNICPKFKQYTRITWVLNDATAAHFAQTNKNVQSYDIIAVRPSDEKTLHMVCTQLDVDIISLNLLEKNTFKFKRTSIKAATTRGISFEICYSPMIEDHFSCVNIISNIQDLYIICNKVIIIMSSGSENRHSIRGPADVANLCCLFDIPQGKRMSTVSKSCLATLNHAFTRKTAKGVLMVETIDVD